MPSNQNAVNILRYETMPFANEPSAENAGGFRRLAFTEPINDKGKEKKQQVNPALRLPASVCALNQSQGTKD